MSKPFDDLPDDDNPFAAPRADPSADEVAPRSEVEVIRYRYLGGEHYIQAVGLLVLASAVLFLILGVSLFIVGNTRLGRPAGLGPDAVHFATFLRVLGAVVFGAGGLGLFVGLGLRSYNLAAQTVAIVALLLGVVGSATTIVTSAIGGEVEGAVWGIWLAGFSGPCLYALLNAKARAIFSREYREVVARTPHIKPRSGCLLVVAASIAMFLAGLAIAAVGMLIGR